MLIRAEIKAWKLRIARTKVNEALEQMHILGVVDDQEGGALGVQRSVIERHLREALVQVESAIQQINTAHKPDE